MPTKASTIRNALRLLGEPSNVTEDSEKKIVQEIKGAWDDVVARVFEEHPWNFFKSLTQLTQTTPAIEGWGFTFNQPASLARIIKVSNYAREDGPPVPYSFQAGKILCNFEQVFCWYVDRTYQTQEGCWPQAFSDLVAAHLADEVYRVTDDENETRMKINQALIERASKAKALDASTDPVVHAPVGGYVLARCRQPGGWRA